MPPPVAVVEGDAETTKQNLSNLVERLGKRFYPSPAAFPFGELEETASGSYVTRAYLCSST